MTIKCWILAAVIAITSTLGTVYAGADEGKCVKLLTTVCNDCHNSDRICENMGGTQKKWRALIDWMISNGAELEEEEQTILIDCLSKPYDGAKKICNK